MNSKYQEKHQSQRQCKQGDSTKRIHKMKQFTSDDDAILLELVRHHGPKFHKFLKYFPYKNLNSLKNRYYKKLRHIEKEEQTSRAQESQSLANDLTNSIKQSFPEEISLLMENVVTKLANLTQFR